MNDSSQNTGAEQGLISLLKKICPTFEDGEHDASVEGVIGVDGGGREVPAAHSPVHTAGETVVAHARHLPRNIHSFFMKCLGSRSALIWSPGSGSVLEMRIQIQEHGN